jgi:hypothetical protein
MANPIAPVIEWLASLIDSPNPSPEVARAFVANPAQAASTAVGYPVSQAMLSNAATAVAAPSVALGGGDPVVGMQQAVANTHGIAFVPQTQTQAFSNNDTLSHNDTLSNNDVLSNNDPHILSPQAGHDVQQGGVNLDFGDITFGDKTTNTATEGGVVNTGTVGGDIDATNVEGDGNVVGDDNNANTGKIEDSNVNIGEDNEIDDRGDQTAGGDIISGNEGPVINDVDMSGGDGGNASAGGGLLGGGQANGGGGGGGGGITINDNDSVSTGGGDVTNVDTGGGDISGSVDASHDDNSVDNSTTDNSVDNSTTDNSVDNSQTVETNVDVSNDVGIF